jgi:hypothetical protein
MPPEDERTRLVGRWLEKAEEDLRGADLMQQSAGLLGLATLDSPPQTYPA